MICMTLSHRMNRIRGDPGSNQKALVEKFYMYRGDAIRSLREHLSLEHHRLSDVAITGIVTLLLTDVRQFSSKPLTPRHVGSCAN